MAIVKGYLLISYIYKINKYKRQYQYSRKIYKILIYCLCLLERE